MATPSPLSLHEAASLVQDRDSVLTGLATGQACQLLEAIGTREHHQELTVYCGLMVYPYSFLQRAGVAIRSGFFGPIERDARRSGADIEYVPSDFIGMEQLALRMAPRVVIAPTTLPDAEGRVSFGLHSGASFRAFLDAARDPNRLAIAEANASMPWVAGVSSFGDHSVSVAELDAYTVVEGAQFALPPSAPTEAEIRIAHHAAELIDEGSTLQFGIGAIPDTIAKLLAEATGKRGCYGIHSEMISDGVMELHRAGAVVNKKGIHDGLSVATFALGSQKFYDWLDHNPEVAMLPVSSVNDACVIRRLPKFVSINTALTVDLLGQVVADQIDGRQYSGVGGHESFVAASTEAPDGKSLLCLKSTATVGGQTVSTIVPRIPSSASVTTPRHHLDYVVTEFGSVEVFGLGDRSRARALASIAHPDFREELERAAELEIG